MRQPHPEYRLLLNTTGGQIEMVSFEHVRKLMGWCPNAGAIETRKSVQFDDMRVNAPGSGGELTHTTAGWWNKYRNRILIQSTVVTLLALNWFISYGISKMTPNDAPLIPALNRH
jgi:hypothetical protein